MALQIRLTPVCGEAERCVCKVRFTELLEVATKDGATIASSIIMVMQEILKTIQSGLVCKRRDEHWARAIHIFVVEGVMAVESCTLRVLALGRSLFGEEPVAK